MDKRDHDNKVIIKACVVFGILTILFTIGGALIPILDGSVKFGDKKTTTTTKAPNKDGVVEYDVMKYSDIGEQTYYATNFILKDNTLYALPTSDWKNAEPTFEYNGKKYVNIASNVEKVYMVAPGQGGIVQTYYTDKELNAHYVYNLVDTENKPGATRQIDGAKNIVDIYDIGGYDTIDLVMINKDNQIVAYDGNYVSYDKKNKRGTNILPNGTVIELSDPVVSTINEDLSNLSMKMTVNGKETAKRADYEMDDDMASYKDIDLFAFKLCKDKKGNYQAGEVCIK